MEGYWGLQKAEKQSFSILHWVQKSPGLDELRVATHPVVQPTIPGSLFSEHLLEMLQAVSTSLDNTIQLAAEGNHGPQFNAHRSAPLPDQAQLEGGNWAKQGTWLGSSSSIILQAIGGLN